MKSLREFSPVMKALERVSVENIIRYDNGTFNKEYICSYWALDTQISKEKKALELQLTAAIFASNEAEIIRITKEMKAIKGDLNYLIFKLAEPIPVLTGSKVIFAGKKSYHPQMNNVEFFKIREDLLEPEIGAVEFEELPDEAFDQQGQETTMIKLRLKGAMIDILERKVNKLGKEWRPNSAHVTILSYRSMQEGSRIIGDNEFEQEKIFGMREIS